MICAAIQVLRSRDTLALINQNKEIHFYFNFDIRHNYVGA
jgi:hypothetical protein